MANAQEEVIGAGLFSNLKAREVEKKKKKESSQEWQESCSKLRKVGEGYQGPFLSDCCSYRCHEAVPAHRGPPWLLDQNVLPWQIKSCLRHLWPPGYTTLGLPWYLFIDVSKLLNASSLGTLNEVCPLSMQQRKLRYREAKFPFLFLNLTFRDLILDWDLTFQFLGLSLSNASLVEN